jgi:hypothetical protein
LPTNTVVLSSDKPQTVNVVELPNEKLGQILHLEYLSADSAIVASNRALYLVINDTVRYRIGNKGKGPREYQFLTSFDVVSDTIIILDKGVKVLYHNLRNNTTIREYIHPKIQWAKSICQMPDGRLLLADMPDPDNPSDKKLMYTLNPFEANSSLTYLSLSQKDIELPKILLPVKSPLANNVVRHKGYIISWFLLSPYLIMYNTNQNQFVFIRLQLSIKNSEKASEANDAMILDGSDIVNGVYCLPTMFAVVVLKPNNLDKTKRQEYIQWYSYDGEAIGETKLESSQFGFYGRIMDVREDIIHIFVLDTTSSTKNPYKIVKIRYEISKKFGKS